MKIKKFLQPLQRRISAISINFGIFVFNCLFVNALFANPIGGIVEHGNIHISNPTSNQTVINQTSQKGIINWNSFNISAGERTHFQQPAGGATLNRISPTQGASAIYGQLTATGQIILVNPAGVYFGPNAYVNVGGLIATTADLSSQNFLQNNYSFTNAGEGKIINQGTLIAAKHGLIALVGNEVENNGMIRAQLGNVILANAEAFTINFNNDQINFKVDMQSKTPASITNNGKIVANGGKILMSSKSVSGVLDHVINIKGVVQANSVGIHKGEIILSAGHIKVTGKIYAKGRTHIEKGGTVKLYAQKLMIGDGAVIDVSAQSDGGVIIIGNKLHQALSSPATLETIIDKNAKLFADSTKSGNGGKIEIWSDELTQFLGSAYARGGSEAGNGGWVEVSGKTNLVYNGLVDTSAPNGLMGTLFLDPKFIIVTLLGGGFIDLDNQYTNNASGTNLISPISLVLAGMSSNILLQANSDVIFEADLHLLGSGSLTVQAGRSILIHSNISTNNQAITMTANDATAIAANRSINNTGNPLGDNETLTGNIIMSSGSSLNAGTGNINLTVADFTSSPFFSGNIVLNALTAKNINVVSSNAITVNGAVNAANNVVMQAKQSGIILNNTIQASGSNYALILAGRSFVNNVDANVLQTPNGNYQVWSGSPELDSRNGIAFNFKQYNANYGVTSLAGTGNGFLYTIAPVIAPVLVGNIVKVYDTNTNAVIAAGNYSYNGILDNDIAVLTQPTSGLYDNKNVAINKTVFVTGINLVSVTSEGVPVYGYQFQSTATGNVGEITPVMLNPSLTNITTKVYDATTHINMTASNFALSGVLPGDNVFLNNPTSGELITPDVGNNKTVTVGGLGLSGSDSGNYVLSNLAVSGPIGFVFPAPLTVDLQGIVTKVYDRNTNATLTPGNYALNGVFSGDNVLLNNPVAGQYDTPNVGTNKLVSVTGLAISGSSAHNYLLINDNASGNIGTITPAQLIASLTGNVTKVYDTNTNATLGSGNYVLSGVLGSDTVILNNPTAGQYDTPNVGTNKLVSVTGLAISGSDAGNYQLVADNASGNIGTITPAQLIASLTGNVTKVYDTNTNATLGSGNYVLSGVLGSDTVVLNNPTAGQYDTPNVGTNKLVSVDGLVISGSDAGNYQLVSDNASGNIGTITPAQLIASLTGNVTKVYDTNTNATLGSGNYVLSGVLGSDTIVLNNPTAGQYDTPNVGTNKLVSVTGLAISGSDAGNYQLVADNASGNIGTITPAQLIASLTGNVTKVYDTNTNATLGSGNYVLSGVLGSDTVVLNNPTAGQYDTPNVGTNKLVSVTGLAISGSDAGNYQLVADNASGNIGTITPAQLIASLTGNVTKVYDTHTNATLGSGNYVLSGVLGSDTVVLNNPTAGQYDTPNVGTNKLVSVDGLVISGSDAGNYQLVSDNASGNIGTITPASLTVTLTGEVTKVYDTNTNATLASNNYILNGVIGSDNVNLNNPVAGQYDTPDVGTNKLVSVDGLVINGSDASNYQLVSGNASGNIGTITPASLTVSLTGEVIKVFDGNTDAVLTPANYVLTGVLGGDNVVLNNPVDGQYDTPVIGTNKLVSVEGLIISGTDAGNYQLVATNSNGNIGTITGITVPEEPGVINPPIITNPPVTPVNPSVPPNIIFPVDNNPPVTVNPNNPIIVSSVITQQPSRLILSNQNIVQEQTQLPLQQMQQVFMNTVPFFAWQAYGLRDFLANRMNQLALLGLLGSSLLYFFIFKRRTEELSDLSFKIRTAMEGIVGFTNLLSLRKIGAVDSQQQEFLGDIMKGAEGVMKELAEVEKHNLFVPDKQMAFNLRTALQDISGFAKMLQESFTDPDQRNMMRDILLGSNDILKLIPAK